MRGIHHVSLEELDRIPKNKKHTKGPGHCINKKVKIHDSEKVPNLLSRIITLLWREKEYGNADAK